MALPLLPPMEAGATAPRRENLIGWADFDPYGVQTAPVTTSDDMRGPNEYWRFQRDAIEVVNAEHDANGIHDTLQIARLFLVCDYNTTDGYTVSLDSYVMGTYERDDTAAFTVTEGAAGEITVDLDAAYSLPNASYMGVIDRTGSLYTVTGEMAYCRTQLRSITNAKTFLLSRRAGVVANALALSHGPFAISLFTAA